MRTPISTPFQNPRLYAFVLIRCSCRMSSAFSFDLRIIFPQDGEGGKSLISNGEPGTMIRKDCVSRDVGS